MYYLITIIMTKEWYELRIVYSRETPFETKMPETIITFNSKDKCYDYYNNYTHTDHLYIEISIKKDNGYNLYNRLLTRKENKPERFSREKWEAFATSKNMTAGIVGILGGSVMYLAMDENKMMKVLCNISDLKTCMIRGKTKMLISDNSNNFYKIIEYMKKI